MAVKRVWFPNAPSSGIDILDRSQVAIGYPLSFVAGQIVQVLKSSFTSYLRRYLNDVVVAGSTTALIPTVRISKNNSVGGFWEVNKNDLIIYVRRYLCDPDTNITLSGSAVPFDNDAFDF